MRRIAHTLAVSLIAVFPTGADPSWQDEPAPVPVEVRSHASRIGRDGTFDLRLTFHPREDLDQRYTLRIALDCWTEEPPVFDHELKPATNRWRTGQEVDFRVKLRVPEDNPLEFGQSMIVSIGFLDPESNEVHPPVNGRPDLDGLVEVAALPMPGFLGEAGEARLKELFDEARRLKASGEAPRAWDELENGLRHASDDETKERFRDALIEVGRFLPAEITPLEKRIVESRIRGEQVRYWRLIAGRMYDRGELHGALRLLEKAGGSLDEQADAEVIGAVGEADRVSQSIEDLREKLTKEPTGEQQAFITGRIDAQGLTAELLRETEQLIEKGRYPEALGLLRRLRSSDDDEVEEEAWKRIPDVEEAYLAATPADQAAKVRAAIEHPAWARTKFVASHCFVFIGPEDLVEGIPAASKLYFDLAYVFITDLFGRLPNPDGDRVTVYFKELWDFGGGVGGGKIIDIGKAQERPAKPVRVDNGLLYHELTHCIDDTTPIFAGFREGLANMGAAYAFEALDQDSDALHSFDSNLEQFKKYFLDRDLEYWRIQNYGPSAGFFLHFVETYARLGKAQHDWSPLRQFFREYRDAPIRDGREPYIVRALGHFLVRAFGPEAFDDLVAFGFPLKEIDRRAIGLEVDAFDLDDLDMFEDAYPEFPSSPLPRDLVGRLVARAADWEDEGSADLRAEHGVLFQWRTVGPFFTRSADPGGCPFEPEWHVDFDKPVPALRATKDANTQLIWRDPVGTWTPDADRSPVTIDAGGWMHFDYEPYGQRNAAIYALTHITVTEPVEAMFHLRADDDFHLFVDRERIGAYGGRGTNGSSRNGSWRGPFKMLPDAHRFLVHLEAGRHSVMVKIKNRYGAAGLVVAVSHSDGSTLAFQEDRELPRERPEPRKASWKRVAYLDHRSYKGKTRTTVGGFRASGKTFAGNSDDQGVAWRMFTVRPGFPKDSPSNLFWLRSKLTEDLQDLRIDIELGAKREAPKLLVTFQGEGENDGLSGWNLILVPSGRDRVSARLERYDRLVYHTEPLELSDSKESRRLLLTCLDDEVSVTLDDVTFFDRVPIYPIQGAHRVGLATWGSEPRIRSMEVSRAKR